MSNKYLVYRFRLHSFGIGKYETVTCENSESAVDLCLAIARNRGDKLLCVYQTNVELLDVMKNPRFTLYYTSENKYI